MNTPKSCPTPLWLRALSATLGRPPTRSFSSPRTSPWCRRGCAPLSGPSTSRHRYATCHCCACWSTRWPSGTTRRGGGASPRWRPWPCATPCSRPPAWVCPIRSTSYEAAMCGVTRSEACCGCGSAPGCGNGGNHFRTLPSWECASIQKLQNVRYIQ